MTLKIIAQTKVCGSAACEMAGMAQPIENFYKDAQKADGFGFYCKTCVDEKVRARAKNMSPAKFRLERKKAQIKYLYGLDWDEWLDLTMEGCQICGNEEMDKLCVDHDHDTGKVRGALCGECNRGIGAFQDNIFTLRKAIQYLENYRG